MTQLHDLPKLELEQLHALKAIAGDALVEKIDAELERRRRNAMQHGATRRTTSRPSVTDRLEGEEQALIVKDLERIGCKVYSLSQPRETMQTEGLPDLYVFGPAERQATWIEVKRQVGGKIGLAQSEFAARCRAAGVDHVLGDRRDVADHYGYTYEEE